MHMFIDHDIITQDSSCIIYVVNCFREPKEDFLELQATTLKIKTVTLKKFVKKIILSL